MENNLTKEDELFLKLFKANLQIKEYAKQNLILLKQIDDLENRLKECEEELNKPFEKSKRREIMKEEIYIELRMQLDSAASKNKKIVLENKKLLGELIAIKKKYNEL